LLSPTPPTTAPASLLRSLCSSFPLRHPPTSPLFPYTTLFRSRSPRGDPPRAPPPRRPPLSPLRASRAPLPAAPRGARPDGRLTGDRKSTRLNSSHQIISYAVFCLKKKKQAHHRPHAERGTHGQ